jgi:hypothetical protein
LLILAPHRDSRRLIRLRSAELFRAGFFGAWSFPQVVPLAVLSAPFAEDELKALARSLRALNLERGIRTGDMGAAPLPLGPGEWRLAGPSLDLALPEPFPLGEDKVRRRISPLLFGAALIRNGEKVPEIDIPPLSFRAAAVANMIYRPLDASGYSFYWRMGKPAWLPPPRKAPRRELR